MTLHLLLIHGNVQSSAAIESALQGGVDQSIQVQCAGSLAQGLRILDSNDGAPLNADDKLSGIMVDLALPDAPGLEVFDRLFAVAPRIPILILACDEDEETARAAVRRGARGYFLTQRVENYWFPKAVASLISQTVIQETRVDKEADAQAVLSSMADAVISTSTSGAVTYLNAAAERLTGWACGEAVGRSLHDVYRIVDGNTRLPLPDPTANTQGNHSLGMPHFCVLIARGGADAVIEHSCEPILNHLKQVTGAVLVFREISAARKAHAKLAYLAQHDSLTDLPNRVFLNDRLAQSIMMAQRHQTFLAVLYLDLDRFKYINDSLGHLVGDRLLQSVALRLSQCVRVSDTVSRQGGDEFVILLSEIARVEDAVTCATKVIEALQIPYVLDEHEIFVTASVGIVIYPEDGANAETLLANADSAMYEAKERGRNTYQFYRSDVNSKAVERQLIEKGLRQAIQRHEFELHYQPLVNLATGAVSGVEALTRWQHPTLGFLLPAQFMSIAEESGLIVPIGRWVLGEACRQAHRWQSTCAPQLRLAVNISAVELRSSDFLSAVKMILRDTGFDPTLLDLELTETFLMQDSKSTALLLQEIRDLGVRLALDDFGTGYSSLSYMRRFPIDVLKIDRSFVSNLTLNVDDASVVSAIINMGKSLHMRVIAEGVETDEQLVFLEEHDCAEAQGYCFSRPLNADAFGELLLNPTPLAGKSHSLLTAYEPVAQLSQGATPIKLPNAPQSAPDSYPVPFNERERLEELYKYKILDTPPEESFDRLTRLAAQTCEAPIALISLVDRDRQWFKSQYGIAFTQTPREQAFCAHTILGTEPLVVENASTDPRFAQNALVRDDPGIRFYAAVPLITSRGFALGSLCVIDRRPRRLTEHTIDTLKTLAEQVVQQIELREVAETLRSRSILLDKVQHTARIGGWEVDLRTNGLTWTHETYRIHGVTPEQYTPTIDSAVNFYSPEARPVIRQALGAAVATAVQFDVELKIVKTEGEPKWVRVLGSREDEAGVPRRVVGVIQDIDDVRRLENEIVQIAQREQTRIGLDLHDGLGQELTGIALMMGGLLSDSMAGSQGLRSQVALIEGLVRSAIGTCATVARGLSPTGRDRRGLIGAIRKLVTRIELLHHVQITLNTQGRAWTLDNTVADHLYRIVQESISNAIKHGPAQRIAISIDWSDQRALVAITSDGSAQAMQGRGEGMGMEIMRYRARLIGATLGIKRTKAGDMRIQCHLPTPTGSSAIPSAEEAVRESDQRWH